MNIIDYINKNGKYSFLEKKLNEVDKLIFSNLSYVDYKDIIDNSHYNKKRLEDVGNEFFKKEYDKGKKILAVRGGINVLKAMYNTNRYKNLLLYNYESIINDKQQFSVITIEINSKLLYVSFGGTDDKTIGWKEDFELAYKKNIKSHNSAVRYLNKNFTFRNCKIIIVGHSKGGNVGLVSSMYANFFVRRKILQIYSYDGPGLLKKELESKRYMRVNSKYIHIIPNNAVVGIMLYSLNNEIIKTKHIGILSHFALNWEVDDNNLISDYLKKSAIELQESMNVWLEKYNDEQKELFVNEMFSMFNNNNINSLVEIAEKPSMLFKLFKEKSKIKNEMFKDFEKMIKRFIFKNLKEMIFKK